MRDATAHTPNTFESIRQAIQGLKAAIRDRSHEIEAGRRLPEDLVSDLRAAGVFRMGFEERLNGPGLTASQQSRLIEELAYADASVGWTVMVGIDSGLFANYLSAEAVDRIFPTRNESCAGMLAPRGTAKRVQGGYVLNGNWTFGSGMWHADRVFAGCHTTENSRPVMESDGRPEWRIMMLDPRDLDISDTWHTTGLAGSGSVDFSARAVYVPHDATFSFREPLLTVGPLSTPDLQMRKMAGVPVGMARAALDYVREVARERVATATGQRWADNYRVQFALGECEMKFIAMRYAVYGTLDDRWDQLSDGLALSDLTLDQQVATALARTNAFRTAREIIRRLYDVMASSAIYEPSPMDRWLRDIETISQHFIAQDQVIQTAGAHLSGGIPEVPLVLGIA